MVYIETQQRKGIGHGEGINETNFQTAPEVKQRTRNKSTMWNSTNSKFGHYPIIPQLHANNKDRFHDMTFNCIIYTICLQSTGGIHSNDIPNVFHWEVTLKRTRGLFILNFPIGNYLFKKNVGQTQQKSSKSMEK